MSTGDDTSAEQPVVPVSEHLERARERHEETAEEPDTYVAPTDEA
ncbi:hypothetical protein [Williamsia maris]|uniref:Uncharacterized protein n=1 Tax=Williamsia maris TaxID=72806 RepID=A0ABT1HDB8_9NOCA|nr:hypothetical protein [Williamsia maris]MCP2175922.1 hypothetical protein [Williamsia maris]